MTNQWLFVTMVLNGSTFTCYTNAVALTLTSGGSPPATQLSTTLQQFTVGAKTGNSGGACGDTRLYNRALRSDEILLLYNGGKDNNGL